MSSLTAMAWRMTIIATLLLLLPEVKDVVGVMVVAEGAWSIFVFFVHLADGMPCRRRTASTRTTWAAKKASTKAESDTDAGDESTEVNTSKSTKLLLDEDEVDEADSTPTPRKHGSKAQNMDSDNDDVAPVKRRPGCPAKAKVVKTPEFVPSNKDQDEPVVPKARSGIEPRKVVIKAEAVDDDMS
ncbi:hypothetical protein GSI_14992 [Ganoderma sinense ZZ0214-1]|uniref:Transporter n=1 Tax=Ganoderma sinense ZZ0214-1 TaxID=1077348 RepID=A0A2G8RLA8_9APHY|nr:hypothetical protein GSI_14992 [Ganoderma sinense ZZ0214-1]